MLADNQMRHFGQFSNNVILQYGTTRDLDNKSIGISDPSLASNLNYFILSWSEQKFIKKCQKWSIWQVFLLCAAKQCYQTALPDSLVLIGQTLVENTKATKLLCDILNSFQTMYMFMIQSWLKL